MDKNQILDQIQKIGLVAVIRGPSVELTLKMVTALVKGGVTGIEITYTTPRATEVVSLLKKEFGAQILLGMGTLTETRQVEEAQTAGAQFLVSPICEENLGEAMRASGLPIMIGALTPTEVYRAYQLGSDVVKLFPGSLVGPAYVKSLKGPFPYIPLMPTGGVSADNVSEWFVAGVFAVGAGSELCPPALAKEGRFEEISIKAKQFISAINRPR